MDQKYKLLREPDHPLALKSIHSPQNQFTAEKRNIHQMMQIWLEILVNKVSKNKLKGQKLKESQSLPSLLRWGGV